jgi:aryl-alcohol dehydrogenase-like predicted oxidoreductase
VDIRNLGNSGLKVGIVGLGCNNFGRRIEFEASRKVVHRALDAGITLFDTADVYGKGESEQTLGQLLGSRRKDIVLATKFGRPMDASGRLRGGSRRYVMQAAEASLKRLDTDWIDLYQFHAPDADTPIEETLRALDDLVRHGKVRYIGCSKFSGWQAVEAFWTAKHLGLNAFVSCQNEYNLLWRDADRELLPAMQAYGLGLLPYYPLAAGLLTGKYTRSGPLPEGARLSKEKRLSDRYMTDANWPVVEQLAAFCAARGHSMLELAFSWMLRRPQVASMIAGATRPEQVDMNVRAADWALTAADMAEIDRITTVSVPDFE